MSREISNNIIFLNFVGDGNATKVLSMLEENPDLIYSSDKLGNTALHIAVSNYDIKMARLLISKKIDVNTLTRWDKSALDFACFKGNLEMVKFLVEDVGADVGKHGRRGETSLFEAIKGNHLKIVKYFIEKVGVNINDLATSGSALCIASFYEKISIAKYLLSKQADCSLFDSKHRSPLHLAVETNNIEMVELFATAGKININLADIDGFTPTLLAKAKGYNKIEIYLLSIGGGYSSSERQDLDRVVSTDISSLGQRDSDASIVSSKILDQHEGVAVVDSISDDHYSIIPFCEEDRVSSISEEILVIGDTPKSSACIML